MGVPAKMGKAACTRGFDKSQLPIAAGVAVNFRWRHFVDIVQKFTPSPLKTDLPVTAPSPGLEGQNNHGIPDDKFLPAAGIAAWNWSLFAWLVSTRHHPGHQPDKAEVNYSIVTKPEAHVPRLGPRTYGAERVCPPRNLAMHLNKMQ